MPNLAKIFHGLHRQTDILILPNAWDAGSAKLIEDAGAKAIATSSAGVAWALGYPDGDTLPPKMLADLAANITDVIRIPLSVDFEGAYTKNPAKVAENLKPIIDAGAVGINIEDGKGIEETWRASVKLRHRHSSNDLEACCGIGEGLPRNWRFKGDVQKLYGLFQITRIVRQMNVNASGTARSDLGYFYGRVMKHPA